MVPDRVGRRNLAPERDWVDWEGNAIAKSGAPPYDHPGWAGYEAVLRLLIDELREFLVVGERDFDLGFQVTSPGPQDQEVPGADWGGVSGWVQPWPRVNHLVLRARNRVYLIVTRSQTSPPLPQATFQFAHASLGATVTATIPYEPDPLASQFQALSGQPYLFEDTIEGIAGRVYRIDLP